MPDPKKKVTILILGKGIARKQRCIVTESGTRKVLYDSRYQESAEDKCDRMKWRIEKTLIGKEAIEELRRISGVHEETDHEKDFNTGHIDDAA